MSTQTFNIALPRLLVRQADKVAKMEFRNRSELIREALLSYLREREEWERIFAFGAVQSKKLGIAGEAAANKLVADSRRGR